MSRAPLMSATLRKDSPFYPIFENGQAPITSLSPMKVKLEGVEGETEAYFLAWPACSFEQQKAIVQMLSKTRGGSECEILDYLDGGGSLPIRVDQTEGASASTRAFL